MDARCPTCGHDMKSFANEELGILSALVLVRQLVDQKAAFDSQCDHSKKVRDFLEISHVQCFLDSGEGKEYRSWDGVLRALRTMYVVHVGSINGAAGKVALLVNVGSINATLLKATKESVKIVDAVNTTAKAATEESKGMLVTMALKDGTKRTIMVRYSSGLNKYLEFRRLVESEYVRLNPESFKVENFR